MLAETPEGGEDMVASDTLGFIGTAR